VVTIIYSDIFYKGHNPWFYHPERPERVKTAITALREHDLVDKIIEPPKADEEHLYLAHSREYVSEIKRYRDHAPTLIDSDTYMARDSYDTCLYAVGASISAAEMAYKSGEIVFAIVRPPGHHAGRNGRAFWAPTLGFCIFNNIAVATAKLLEDGVDEVVIIDFDLHHGNGTQDIFYGEPRVIHIDIHQDPTTIYPGTGFITDYGRGEAEGTKINIPLPVGSGDDEYKLVIEEILIPILDDIKPKILLFSAGFDAYSGDGLGGIYATADTFYTLGLLPRRLGIKKVAAILEGGYSVGISRGAPAFAAGLSGQYSPVKDLKKPSTGRASSRIRDVIEDVKKILGKFYKF